MDPLHGVMSFSQIIAFHRSFSSNDTTANFKFYWCFVVLLDTLFKSACLPVLSVLLHFYAGLLSFVKSTQLPVLTAFHRKSCLIFFHHVSLFSLAPLSLAHIIHSVNLNNITKWMASLNTLVPNPGPEDPLTLWFSSCPSPDQLVIGWTSLIQVIISAFNLKKG